MTQRVGKIPALKVLFLSQRVPWPPDRGDRVTTWNVLRHLLEQGAEVRVACLAENARDRELARALAPRVAAIEAAPIRPWARRLASLRGLLTGASLNLVYFRCRRLERVIADWVASDPPDLVYVYSASVAQWVLRHRSGVRVMQFAELDSDKYRQYAARGGALARAVYAREARKLLELERQVAREFDVALVVSEVEKALFSAQIDGVEPKVVPNGVDVQHFRSSGDGRREPHTLIFSGVMSYEPNVDGVLWFVAECWPAIRARFPDAALLVVGSQPTRAIRALHGRRGIEVTGRVAETPPWFERAAIALAPLRMARGVQNKVLEAMSMGLPTIATPQACQGLGPIPTGALIRAEGREAWSAAACRLLEDPSEARAIGLQAAAFVRASFAWPAMLARFDAAIAERWPGYPRTSR